MHSEPTALATPPPADVTPPWLTSLCELVQRHSKHFTGWDARLWEGGVHLDLHVRGEGERSDQTVGFRMRHLVDEQAYGHTRSFTIAMQLPRNTTLTLEAKKVVEALFKLIKRADHDTADLPLPKLETVIAPEQTQVHVPSRSPDGLDVSHDDDRLTLDAVLAWRSAHETYAKELQLNAFIALQAMINDDLYPHVIGLGEELREEDILASWHQTSRYMDEGRAPQKLGLYCHVPFCTIECTFCYCGKTENFVRNDVDTYVDQLLHEADLFAPTVANQQFTSVYFGGGTPSLLTPKALRRVFTHYYDVFDVPEGTQVVFEGNPDSLKPAKVEILADLGRVTRLTVGIQTLDPAVQKYVRRYNKKKDVEAAIQAARDGNIPHLNFDCIAGLEGQSMESFQADVRYLLSLGPDSIHLNGFRPLPRTNYRKQGRAMSVEQEALRDRMLEWGHALLADSGYANQMQQGPHRTADAANLQEYDLRRQNSSLVGLGFPSRAHSFGGYYYIRDTRKGFVPELKHQNSGDRRWFGVAADHREEMHKFLVTNIRNGVDRKEFQDLFGVDVVEAMSEPLDVLTSLGAVDIRPNRVHFHTGNLVDSLIYRVFCYSPTHRDRAMTVWGHLFDPTEDYRRILEQYVPKND